MSIIVLIIKYLKIKISTIMKKCFNIETANKASKNVMISYIYRPPRGDAHRFLDKMEGHIIKN